MDEFLTEFDLDLIMDSQRRQEQIENDQYMFELEALRLKSLIPADPKVLDKSRRQRDEQDQIYNWI